MEEKEQNLIQQLCNENPRFRMLYEEHNLLERELANYEHRVHLSSEEEMAKKTAQKLKLAGKDEMEEILRRYRH